MSRSRESKNHEETEAEEQEFRYVTNGHKEEVLPRIQNLPIRA